MMDDLLATLAAVPLGGAAGIAAPGAAALVPIGHAPALEERSNLPGTIDEHPNWRRRLPGAGE